MGMFDRVTVYAKCPYCGEKNYLECQTKQFGCTLDTFKAVPDYYIKNGKLNKKLSLFGIKQELNAYTKIDTKVEKVKAIVVCNSPECAFDAHRAALLEDPDSTVLHYGRHFYCNLPVQEGYILSIFKDIEHEKRYRESTLVKYKDNPKVAKVLKRIMPLCKNQEVLALRKWSKYKYENDKRIKHD